MAQTYRREEIKAGAVILVSGAILSVAIFLVARGGLESTPREYRIEFAGVGGLERGAQVRFGGVRVGRVLRITPPGKDSPRVQVVIGLGQDVVLRAGTVANISTLGLVGEHYIELSNPKPGPGEIPPGGLLAARDQPSMAELVQSAGELGEAAKVLLARIQAVVDGPVNDFIQQTTRAMETGDRVLKGLDQTLSGENRENLRRSLAAVAAVVEENRGPLRAAVADLGMLIRRVDAATADAGGLLRDGGALVRRLDAAVAEGGGLIRKLDAAVDPEGGDLKGTLGVMKADLERAREVLDRMDRAIANFDRVVTGNLETIEETLANLRRASQNAKELTQTLKERPWQALFPEPIKDREVVR